MTMPAQYTQQDAQSSMANMGGWSMAFWMSDPELMAVYQRYERGGDYSENGVQRAIADLKGTRWYQSHGEAARQQVALMTSDPATYNQKVETQYQDILGIAGQMGAQMDPQTAQNIAKQALMLGWDETQIKRAMASYVNIQTKGPLAGGFSGDAGATERYMQQVADANGFQYSPQSMTAWVRNVARGDATAADYAQFFRNQAANMYPAFANQLKAGMDLKDLATPYVQSMANILEISPTEITLQDGNIRQAMSQVNKQGNDQTAMPMWEFENKLRQDARYQMTDGAHQQVASQALRLGQMMGVTG